MKNQQSMIARIEADLGLPSLFDKLTDDLSPSDFSSLLTAVFDRRTEHIEPPMLLKQYASRSYAKPASCDGARYRRLEADMLDAADEAGVKSIILSPTAMLGCCSAFDACSQDKIISATRGLEVLSDATNMLALYIADAMRSGLQSHQAGPIHVCTTHRHVRYYSELPEGCLPHFGLFTMVSAGHSQSSYAFEIEALAFHLRFYVDYWTKMYSSPMHVKLNRRRGYKDSEGFFIRVFDALRAMLPDTDIGIDERENDTAYYKGLRATMRVDVDGHEVEIGDLGFTDWTEKLLNQKSERLLISSMALDRQMAILSQQPTSCS